MQIRTIELKWKQEELIVFLFKRLFGNNREILKRYVGLVHYYTYDFADETIRKMSRLDLNQLVDENMGVIAELSKKCLYTFFPDKVMHTNAEGKEEEMDFIEWVYRHFEDYTEHINLRYLIVFFNQLFKLQYDTYEKNLGTYIAIGCRETENGLYYPIFSDTCINTAYHIVQKIAVLNIRSLLDKEACRECFDCIHQMVMQKNGSMSYGDIHYAKYELTKEEYDTLLETLCILGYLKNSGKKYMIPILYRYVIE